MLARIAGRPARSAAALAVLALVTLLVLGAPDSRPRAARDAAALVASLPDVLDADGGRKILGCALAVGLMVGGALALGAHPLGGASAISLGMHLAMFTCM